jgi:spore germination cell wall hydrolase CwlJ-like protein
METTTRTQGSFIEPREVNSLNAMSQKIVTPNERRNNMFQPLRIGSVLLSIVAVVFLVSIITNYKFQKIAGQNGYKFVSVESVKKDLDCLALNIYREAGHESFEGKVGVAQVTLNRVADPRFPKTVCGVVYEKTAVYSKVICQFSWYCDANHRNRKINEEAYADSYAVAKKVLLEGFRLDGLTDALYYHADYVSPNWKMERVAKIGAHIFYRGKPNERI